MDVAISQAREGCSFGVLAQIERDENSFDHDKAINKAESARVKFRALTDHNSHRSSARLTDIGNGEMR